MKYKLLFACSALLFVLLVSCTDKEIIEQLSEKDISVSELNQAFTRSAISPDEFNHLMQTDHLGLLINCIKEENSVYYLTLSAENAKILNISDSLYLKVQEMVRVLNNPE